MFKERQSGLDKPLIHVGVFFEKDVSIGITRNRDALKNRAFYCRQYLNVDAGEKR